MSDENDNQPVLPPDPKEQRPGAVPEQPPAAEETFTEDSGTRALSEALSSSFLFVKIIVAILIAGFVFSCIRTVNPNEEAIILRFGKPVGDPIVRKQGLHWAFPYPIDEVVKIPVGESRSLRSTVGFYNYTQMQISQEMPVEEIERIVPGAHGYTITADHNIIHVRATMKYRITDPERYLFDFESPANLLQNILDNAIVFTSARFTADGALYKRKQEFTDVVRRRITDSTLAAGLRIAIESLDVDREPPLYVRNLFERVQESEQMRSKSINEAQAYANQVTTKAVGESNAVISAGITRSNRLARAISAEAEYFKDVLPHYRRNSDLFEQRVRIETLRSVFTNAENIFYVPSRSDGKPRELRIDLNRQPEKPGKN